MKSFKDIAQEATEYGVALRDAPGGCIQFCNEGGQTILAHMWHLGGRKWRGYASFGMPPRTLTGGKGIVADWCLDIAVNG